MKFLFHIRWFLYAHKWILIAWLFAYIAVVTGPSLQIMMPVTLIISAIMGFLLIVAFAALIITDTHLEEQEIIRKYREREDH